MIRRIIRNWLEERMARAILRSMRWKALADEVEAERQRERLRQRRA